MSVDDDRSPDIQAKEVADETPMRGRGYAHLDLPHARFGLGPEDDISPGEVMVEGIDGEILVTFSFDTLGSDIRAADEEFGFNLDADTAELLAARLAAYAEHVHTGEGDAPGGHR